MNPENNTQAASELDPQSTPITLPKSYNNQLKGSGLGVYGLAFLIAIGLIISGGNKTAGFVMGVPIIVFCAIMLTRRLVVKQDGITIHYFLHKRKLAWSQIAKIDFWTEDWLNAPTIFENNGKTHRITMAFRMNMKLRFISSLNVMDTYVSAKDKLNYEIMTQLKTLLVTYNPSVAKQAAQPISVESDLAHPSSRTAYREAREDRDQLINEELEHRQ